MVQPPPPTPPPPPHPALQGLHHNGLLSLAAVRLVQTPKESPGHKPYLCYRASAEVLRGDPLNPRSRRGAALASSVQTLVAVAGAQSPGKSMDPCHDASGGGNCSAHGPRAGRAGWCIAADDVDGLTVELGDLTTASLTRVQLGWWARGYAFPNTPWRDDLRDLALSLCGFAEGAIEGGFAQAAGGHVESLCAAMHGGQYAHNPLAALLHPLFSGSTSDAGGARDGGGAAGKNSTDRPIGAASGDDGPWPGLARTCEVPASHRRLHAYTPRTRARRPPRSSTGALAAQSGSLPAGTSHAGNRSSIVSLSPDGTVLRAQLLDFLAPLPPSVWSSGRGGITAAWNPHPSTATSPQPEPTAFNLLLNGISVCELGGTRVGGWVVVGGGGCCVGPDYFRYSNISTIS